MGGEYVAAIPESDVSFDTSGGHDHDGSDSKVLADATDTVKGVIELATAAETTTGTDAGRAVTPDGLAGSDFGKRIFYFPVIAEATAVTTGDGKRTVFIPQELNGMNLVAAQAFVHTPSTSGLPTMMIHNLTDAADMLSTAITIDETEYDSCHAATPPVVDTAHDDVASGDRIRVDVDGAGTGTAGLDVALTFAPA